MEVLSAAGREAPHNNPIAFLLAAPLMVKKARAATRRSDSYRVHVGASIGLQHADELSYDVLKLITRSNDKPTAAYEVRKRCAETKLFKIARAGAIQNGPDRVTGLTIAGPSDISVIESITKVKTPTLHSCDVCLGSVDFYQQEGTLLIPNNMPILTTHLQYDKPAGKNVFQVMGLDEMRAFHIRGHGFVEDLTIEHTYDDDRKFSLLRKAGEIALDNRALAETMEPAHYIRVMLDHAAVELVAAG